MCEANRSLQRRLNVAPETRWEPVFSPGLNLASSKQVATPTCPPGASAQPSAAPACLFSSPPAPSGERTANLPTILFVPRQPWVSASSLLLVINPLIASFRRLPARGALGFERISVDLGV